MAFRDVVVNWFGEGVARRIEQFVDGQVFGDTLVTCPQCQTPVAATLITERGVCPVCRTVATKDLSIETLEIRKRAALAAGQEANNEVERDRAIIKRQTEDRMMDGAGYQRNGRDLRRGIRR